MAKRKSRTKLQKAVGTPTATDTEKTSSSPEIPTEPKTSTSPADTVGTPTAATPDSASSPPPAESPGPDQVAPLPLEFFIERGIVAAMSVVDRQVNKEVTRILMSFRAELVSMNPTAPTLVEGVVQRAISRYLQARDGEYAAPVTE